MPVAQPFYLYVERAGAHFALHGYGCGGAGEPCGAAGRPYFRPAMPVTRGQAAQAVANAFLPGRVPPLTVSAARALRAG